MTESFKDRLKGMKENWEQGKEPPEQVPDGIYTFRLQSAELRESMSSGKMLIHREHLVSDGEYQGEVVHDNMMLETERGPFYVTQWIEQMGLESPEDPSELEEVCASLTEMAPTYTGRVVNRDGFTNIRILKLLDSGEIPEPAETGGDGGLVGETVVFKEDGEECEVVSDDGEGNLTIKDAKGDEYECTTDDVTINAEEVEEGEEEEEEEAEPEKEEADEQREELMAFCQSQDIDCDEDDTVESLSEKICEYEWDPAVLVKDEVALLKSIDADFEKKASKKAAKKTGKKTGKKKSGKKR